eukprot:13100825-Alexandrium_andersonii.AAC.1
MADVCVDPVVVSAVMRVCAFRRAWYKDPESRERAARMYDLYMQQSHPAVVGALPEQDGQGSDGENVERERERDM